MDNAQFDAIIKTLSRSRSRRTVLRGVAVSTGVGLVARLSQRGEVLAAPPKRTCLGHGDPCDPLIGGCCKQFACNGGVCLHPSKKH